MIKFTRDGFGTLTLYVTFKGKRHIFKHWKYQGWYEYDKYIPTEKEMEVISKDTERLRAYKRSRVEVAEKLLEESEKE